MVESKNILVDNIYLSSTSEDYQASFEYQFLVSQMTDTQGNRRIQAISETLMVLTPSTVTMSPYRY